VPRWRDFRLPGREGRLLEKQSPKGNRVGSGVGKSKQGKLQKKEVNRVVRHSPLKRQKEESLLGRGGRSPIERPDDVQESVKDGGVGGGGGDIGGKERIGHKAYALITFRRRLIDAMGLQKGFKVGGGVIPLAFGDPEGGIGLSLCPKKLKRTG